MVRRIGYKNHEGPDNNMLTAFECEQEGESCHQFLEL